MISFKAIFNVTSIIVIVFITLSSLLFTWSYFYFREYSFDYDLQYYSRMIDLLNAVLYQLLLITLLITTIYLRKVFLTKKVKVI